jgi:hypothetical protein
VKKAEEENVIKEYGQQPLDDCYRANVQVRTNTRISGVKLSDEGVLQFVSIFSAQCSETLPCDDLVLAAGPPTYPMFRLSYATASGGRRGVVLLELIIVRKYYSLTITEYIH